MKHELMELAGDMRDLASEVLYDGERVAAVDSKGQLRLMAADRHDYIDDGEGPFILAQVARCLIRHVAEEWDMRGYSMQVPTGVRAFCERVGHDPADAPSVDDPHDVDGNEVLFRLSCGTPCHVDGSEIRVLEPGTDSRLREAYWRVGKDRDDPVPDAGQHRPDGLYRLIGPGLYGGKPPAPARYMLVPWPDMGYIVLGDFGGER